MTDHSSPLKFFDCQTHFDFPDFDDDRNEQWQRAREKGVRKLVISGVLAKHWQRILELCCSNFAFYPALGLHPSFINEHADDDLDQLKILVENHSVVALGEIGLDFYNKDLPQEPQLDLFKSQLKLAQSHELPVILHVRKAHNETLQLLSELAFKEGGIVHAFNGSPDEARRYQRHGFRFGFGGMLTFERSTKIRRLIKELPLEWQVLETDAPDALPANCPSQRNSPVFLPDIFEVFCQVKGGDKGEIANQLWRNSCEVLKIND